GGGGRRIPSPAPEGGARIRLATKPSAPFRGYPVLHAIPKAHALGHCLSPSGLAGSALSSRLWGPAPPWNFGLGELVRDISALRVAGPRGLIAVRIGHPMD